MAAERGRRFTGDRLVIATHNPGKLTEIAALLQGRVAELLAAGSLALPEPEELRADQGGSFLGNARIKALAAAEGSGLPALADDSGFSMQVLGGAPGVDSALWAGPGKDFTPAMARVRALWEQAAAPAEDRAWFSCALALAWPDGHVEAVLGECAGRAIWPPRGSRGFGYDPMFVPEGGSLSFGEMPPEAKHAISHRARAFEALLARCFAD